MLSEEKMKEFSAKLKALLEEYEVDLVPKLNLEIVAQDRIKPEDRK